MSGYNLKDEAEVKEYLKNLHIEYKFGCYNEKNPEVCHLLGDYAEAITQDYKRATELYKMNCDEYKYGRSCAKYGDYNFVGRGCEANNIMGYKYMRKGCDLDDMKGCHHAGVLAISDRELEKDRSVQVADGIKMLTKACNGGQEKACFHLSGVYMSGVTGYVEKNMTEAYKLSLKCCEVGNPYACANISVMHRQGDGVQKDAEMANVFLRRAQSLMDELKVQKRQLKFHEGINP